MFFLFCQAFYEAKPGGDSAGTYKESRAYIAADTEAHPQLKSAMLGENILESGLYEFIGQSSYSLYAELYGFTDLPKYSDSSSADILYVLNSPFYLDEQEMYRELSVANIDTKNMLKIRINDVKVVFKKYIRREKNEAEL
ncbi:hypothetical protein AGMMS50268_01590 [Spirochaetia bacterium]|nr:hypothetical protein AGMMS50268_01590 [Spirochaetia bacterium]